MRSEQTGTNRNQTIGPFAAENIFRKREFSMRRWEIAAAVALLLFMPHLLFPSVGHQGIFVVLLGISVVLIVCHGWFEGLRWQMLPAYFLVIILPIYEAMHALRVFHAPHGSDVVVVLIYLAAIVLCVVLPVFRLPPPTGPYTVGTETRHLVDESRSDPMSDRLGGRRELMIQIWYPADATARGRFAPYRERSITTFKSAHFTLVKSHSILDGRLAQSPARFPLLLYTPSWCGIRTESTALLEELASHGYVVVGIDHPYGSNSVAFPDGTIARRKFVGDEDYSSQAAIDAFVKTANEQIEIRAVDAQFVLTVFEGIDANDPRGVFTGRLDLSRVAIFGCSLGGGTAAEACSLDRRFKAGMNLGGMISSKTVERGLFTPFFFMFEGMYDKPPYVQGADLTNLSPTVRREVAFSLMQFASMKKLLAKCGGYWMTIRGMRHMNLFDAPFFTPLRYGRIRPYRILEIIRQYTLAFLDENLKGIERSPIDRLAADASALHSGGAAGKRIVVRVAKSSAALQPPPNFHRGATGVSTSDVPF
jgi:hypothetical protein